MFCLIWLEQQLCELPYTDYVSSPNTDCASSPNTDASSPNTDCLSSPSTKIVWVLLTQIVRVLLTPIVWVLLTPIVWVLLTSPRTGMRCLPLVVWGGAVLMGWVKSCNEAEYGTSLRLNSYYWGAATVMGQQASMAQSSRLIGCMATGISKSLPKFRWLLLLEKNCQKNTV